MNAKNVRNEADSTDVSKEQLISDLKTVMADAEALIKVTANQGGEALVTARGRAEESIARARAKISDLEEALVLRTKAAVEATDAYVHENPWQAIGVSAALGVLVGLLISRR
ncbi:MAG: DUF883 family protein [Betaproteobacteria bacterium]|nr:DUF883 family protein [Betaproteobacteria bacterium]